MGRGCEERVGGTRERKGDQMGWEGRTRERVRKAGVKKEWVMRWGGGIGGERERGRKGEKERRRRREEKRETNKYDKIKENEEMKKKKKKEERVNIERYRK